MDNKTASEKKEYKETQKTVKRPSPAMAGMKETIKTVLLVSFLVLVTRFFIIQPFVVKGNSMEPNFHDNEYIFVEEVSPKVTGYKRGEIVIFKHPDERCTEFVNSSYINRTFLQGPCTNYIKRVVGLPGETITISSGQITIKNKKNPEGLKLNETYIPDVANYKVRGDLTRTLGKDEYFVLGDNRQPNASSDSREWGALPKSHITGKAWLVVLPFDKFGFVRDPKY